MKPYCVDVNGTQICVDLRQPIRKYPWDDPEDGPWLDLGRIFENLGNPPFRINGEFPHHYNDLVRLEAVGDIVRTIGDESVRETLSAQVEELSSKVRES